MRTLQASRAHRLERAAQVRAEVRRTPGTEGELTRRVYGPDLGKELLVAAEMTMRAHLQKLVDDGQVRVRTGDGTDVFEATAAGKVT